MPSINILDSGTVNQIAAGEVIERPSSVVKELVENALDAGATAVTVEIRDGGISLIRVTDNGCGIAAEDIPLAFLRHSTSKIRSVEDLLTVSSLGFRGEALSSIAAVAQVELITRTPESLTGVRYRIEGGEETGCEEVGAPGGTTFLVRNLFFNTPARRKFLKTAATEGSYISALVERLALSRPDVSFRLLVNNQEKLHTAGNNKLKDIIYTIYGRDITRSLLPLHAETEDVVVDGYIGRPEINRGNRTYENYFVNGRYVRSALITKAIENAYHGFAMQHKYPFAVFHLTIDSALLDVNVHPTKMELRFVREEAVYQAVFQAIRKALTGEELIPRHAFEEKAGKKVTKEEGKPEISRPLRGPEPFETRRRQAETPRESSGSGKEQVEFPREAFNSERRKAEIPREPSTIERMQKNMRNSLLGNQQFQERRDAGTTARGGALVGEHPAQANIVRESFPSNDISPENAPSAKNDSNTASSQENKQTHTQPLKEPVPEPIAPKQLDLFEEKLLTREARAEYHILGQLFDTYWLIQYRDQLLIMDQHAAHEKVLYERTMRSLREKESLSQQVQPPVILTLNAREIEVVTEYRKDFERVGFQIEPFDGREYAVYVVPANLFGIARADLLTEMIDSLADETGHTQMTLVEDKIAGMSCKAAVKGNNRLSQREAEELIDELLQLDNPYQCPHGRPTIITMTRYELEKKFQRVVN